MRIDCRKALPGLLAFAPLFAAMPCRATQEGCTQFIASHAHVPRLEIEGNLETRDSCKLGANGGNFIEVCRTKLATAQIHQTLPAGVHMTDADIKMACEIAAIPPK